MKDFNDMSEKELMMYNSEIMNELKKRGIVRTKNNPIADYCEWFVASKLHWKLQNSSNGGFDAIDSNELRVQIKCRTLENGKGTRQLGVIRNLNKNPFDYLIAILFDEKIDVVKGYKISKELITRYSRFSEHQNGHILTLKGEILSDNELVDITDNIQ